MRLAKLNRLLCFLIILCLSFSYATADEKNTGGTKAYSLGEVVISADMPGSKTIPALEITDKDIEKRNAKTLDKALELLPGIDVTTGGAGTPRINIRGFRSRHAILLLNGIPINSTYDGQFDPHIISTDNISKIKVSYGNNSVLYGQGGLAGVINIITKQGTKGLHMNASGEIDGRGNYYSKANISGGDETTNFFAGIDRTDSAGYRLSRDFKATVFENGGTRNNSDDERLSFFGNLGIQVNDEVEMGLTIESSDGEYGIPSTTTIASDPFYKAPKYDRVEDFGTLSGQVSMSYQPKGIFGFRGWAFANTYNQDFARYDNNTYSTIRNRNNYTNSDETSVKGATLQTSVDFESSGEAVFSLSGEKDNYTSDLNTVLVNNRAAVPYHYDYDLNIYSAAFEYRIQFFSKLDIVTGYSHHWQIKDVGNDENKGSYMVGGSLKLTDSTLLRASYAKKIRFPSIQQLYDPTSGRTTLKPEQSQNYEAGISQKLFEDMELDLTFFQNDVEHYIEKNNTTNFYENNQQYQFKGFETRLSKKILENGTIGFNYSYMDSKDKSSGTLVDELQYRPRHKFSVDADYTWGFGLTAYADFMHVADQYFYSDSFRKGKLNDYSLVNFKLEQKVYNDNYFLYLGVDNLFDKDYEESYRLPRAGRTGYAGVRVSF